jgi:hypothetical protein
MRNDPVAGEVAIGVRDLGDHTFRRRDAQERAGFTLVEAVIAAALAVTTVAICLPVLRLLHQSVALGAQQSMATTLATSRLEELCALAWRFEMPVSGVLQRVSDASTDLSVRPANLGGSGLQPSPPDSLRIGRAGYVDFLDARGQWLGAGPTPPANSAYVRRWSVTPWAPAPADVLVLQVMVGSLAAEPGAVGRQSLDRRPGDAWLLSMRARVRR